MNVYKEQRLKTGLTQKELAQKLYIDQTTVSKWEKDKATPDIKLIPKIATIFNVSIDYLLGNNTTQEEQNTQNRIKKYITPEQEDYLNLFEELNKKYGKDFTENITEGLWKLTQSKDKGEN